MRIISGNKLMLTLFIQTFMYVRK